jgi:hypothetical protein
MIENKINELNWPIFHYLELILPKVL